MEETNDVCMSQVVDEIVRSRVKPIPKSQECVMNYTVEQPVEFPGPQVQQELIAAEKEESGKREGSRW